MNDCFERGPGREWAQYNLALWERPKHYFGPDWPEYYEIAGRNRDSDLLTDSNWSVFVRELEKIDRERKKASGKDSRKKFWQVVSAGHWACGWVETLMLHQDAPEEYCALIRDLYGDMAHYPVLDEEDFYRRQFDAAEDFWVSLSLCARAEYAKVAGVSIFAIRRSWAKVPHDLQDHIMEVIGE